MIKLTENEINQVVSTVRAFLQREKAFVKESYFNQLRGSLRVAQGSLNSTVAEALQADLLGHVIRSKSLQELYREIAYPEDLTKVTFH